MGFSPKRAKAVATGKVLYCIMNGDETVFSSSNFLIAVQNAERLQKENPGVNYTMKLIENNG